MKRRLFKLGLLLLVGGAIVNVAVAWGCALWVKFDGRSYFDGASGGVFEAENAYQHWLVHTQTTVGACDVSSQWADRDLRISLSGSWPDGRPEKLIPAWAWLAIPPSPNPSSGFWHYRWVYARGWPALSLRVGIACDTRTHANTDLVEVRGGIALDSPTLGTMRPIVAAQRFLPVTPIWPGFAINTIFYAAILCLLFFAPGALRRTIRRRRGLCPACAYPIGTSEVCTECGRPVTPRRGAGM